MKRVLITPDSKRVVVDITTDVCLYQSPVNPPNTGTDYTRGTDLYAHKARSGNFYFFKSHWSLWQREDDSLELISRSEAESFLVEKASLVGHGSLDDSEIALISDFSFDIFQESA